MARLTIFHTSDMHNALTPELAEQLADLKDSNPGSLMLDSGDAIWSGNMFWRPGGEPILDLMNQVPYDAACIGNREFHFLRAAMQSKTARAHFPFLSANLRCTAAPSSGQGEGRCLPALPFVRFEREGLRIAVFGLTVPCIRNGLFARAVCYHYFDDPIETAAELVPRLRAESDMLIGLTHTGIKTDRELAARVGGIDLILGGHAHIVTPEPERVGDTLIVHHGCHGLHVGRTEVEIGPDGPQVQDELIPLAKA